MARDISASESHRLASRQHTLHHRDNSCDTMRPTQRLLLGIPRTVRSILVNSVAATANATASSSTAALPTAPAPPADDVTVHGWVRSVRAHKNVAFAEVGDGSGEEIQAVLKGKGRAEG